jgi:Ser/Thr protein kinase RdoA (MazF antagonist)
MNLFFGQLDPVSREILDSYDIGLVSGCEVLGGGMFVKPLLVITDTGKYVLRGHPFRKTETSFEFQAEILSHLRRMGIRTPEVIRDSLGRLGQRRGSAFWALHEYVDGHKYSWTAWQVAKSTPSFLEQTGAQIACIHDALSDAQPTGETSFPLVFPPIQFPYIEAIHRKWNEDLDRLDLVAVPEAPRSQEAIMASRDEVQECWQIVGEEVRSLGIGNLPRQPVHGDVSPVNMIFQDGDPGFVLIDWDCSHLGLRLYDALGDVLNRPSRELVEHSEFDADEIRCYLKGYQAATGRKVTHREMSCVPAFCLARQLEDLRQRLCLLASLTKEQDEEYAVLIRGRIRMLNHIMRAEYKSQRKRTRAW